MTLSFICQKIVAIMREIITVMNKQIQHDFSPTAK